MQKRIAHVTALSRAGQYREGVRQARALLDEAHSWPGTRAQLWFALGQLLVGVEDFDGAVSAQQEAFLLSHEGEDPLLEAQVASELVYSLGWIRDRYSEAALWARLSEVALRKYGGDPRTEIVLLERRARSLFAQKRYAAALPLIERALESASASLRPDDELLSQLHDTHGAVLGGLGRTEESRREYVASLRLAAAALGSQHPRLAQLHNNLGFSLLSDARYEEALEPLRRALELFSRENAKGLGVGIVKGNLAQVLTQLGRADEAVPLARESLAIVAQERGGQHAMLDTYLTPLGWALLRSGQAKEAAEHCAKAAQLQERAGRNPADFLPFESDSLTCLGAAQLKLGLVNAARQTLRRALKTTTAYPGGLAEAKFALAQALGASSSEARALAVQARDEWKGLALEARWREVEHWLGQ